MIVGLYDADMTKYKIVPVNLDLMKLSAYYKKNRQIVSLSTIFNPEKFSKFIIRKDYNDGDFPSEYYADNIEVGGLAYTNNVFKPMKLDIERCMPDNEIYWKFVDLFDINDSYRTLFKTMVNAHHLRLSLDGHEIWDEYESAFDIDSRRSKCYFFHDFDLNQVNHSKEFIDDIIKRYKYDVFFGTKFPIRIYEPNDLLRWCSTPAMLNNFCIEYNGIIPDECFSEYVLTDSTASFQKQLNYNVVYGCSSENDFIVNRLPQIFNQVIFSRIHKTVLSLKYDDNFFVNKKWGLLLDVFNAFNKNIQSVTDEKTLFYAINHATFYDFVKSFISFSTDSKYFTNIDEMREVFFLVKECNYELFKDFYNKSKVKLEGGKFVDDRRIYS